MLNDIIIQASNSPWTAPVVLLKKNCLGKAGFKFIPPCGSHMYCQFRHAHGNIMLFITAFSSYMNCQ